MSEANLHVKYETINDKNSYGNGSSLIGVTNFLYGLRIEKNDLFTCHKMSDDDASYDVEYKQDLKANIRQLHVSPFAGMFVNYVDYSNSQSYDDSVAVTSDEWNERSGIVQNKYGISVQCGVNFRFHKMNREGIVFSILYNQGLTTLLNTTYTADLKGGPEEKRMKSNGSFLSFSIAYPIVLLQNKGDRRWDK